MTDVTHTGVSDASYPYSVRACTQSEYVTVEEESQYDASSIVCTDWWGT
ncbi:hypothetical protein I4I73_11565 [Pseudonocardia sp. KRD-184]|uniref:Uncharacterized protein n=1 Tax=Pseudonocardia oceani TaxID=2792013 RepID=A0ABS6UAY4_9PSEU|nr:hypothetical protein [Pseudonocardia oceani]MBW0089558.1 hypothetical protein [Pseudonocardia oceani]MBW0096623.1 hypothetical protein [Pseudonocardia oceani]MBW0109314.1 hypothetical protein [Pseudonocardia oceani]MBW0123479.1 hypothetical protein [Pseudonocardia oceani]MBW0129378.1 hypothetical protein [Pseudonocardia oceani]